MTGTLCQRCQGSGRVLVDLRSLGLSAGGTSFLAAGVQVVRGDDGSAMHLLVCPRCCGSGHESDQCTDTPA